MNSNITAASTSISTYPRRTIQSVIKYCRDGYGFVLDPDGGEDILLPGSQFSSMGRSTVYSGQSVKCEIVKGPNGWRVDKISITGDILEYPINPFILLEAGMKDFGTLRQHPDFVGGDVMEITEVFQDGKTGFLAPVDNAVGAGRQHGFNRYVLFTGYTFNCAGIVPIHLERGQQFVVDHFSTEEGRRIAVAVRPANTAAQAVVVATPSKANAASIDVPQVAELYAKVASDILQKAVPRIIDAILSRFKVVLPNGGDAVALSREQIVEVVGSLLAKSMNTAEPVETDATKSKPAKKPPELSERQKRRQRRLDSFERKDELQPLIDKLASINVHTIGEFVDHVKAGNSNAPSNIMADIEAIFERPLHALNLRSEKTIKITSPAIFIAESCGMHAEEAFAVIKGKVESIRQELIKLLEEYRPVFDLPKNPRKALETILSFGQDQSANSLNNFPQLLRSYAANSSTEFASQPDEKSFKTFVTTQLQIHAPHALDMTDSLVAIFNGSLHPLDGHNIRPEAVFLLEVLSIPSIELEAVVPALLGKFLYTDEVRQTVGGYPNIKNSMRRSGLYTTEAMAKYIGAELTVEFASKLHRSLSNIDGINLENSPDVVDYLGRVFNLPDEVLVSDKPLPLTSRDNTKSTTTSSSTLRAS